jgi:hypothetical protein
MPPPGFGSFTWETLPKASEVYFFQWPSGSVTLTVLPE